MSLFMLVSRSVLGRVLSRARVVWDWPRAAARVLSDRLGLVLRCVQAPVVPLQPGGRLCEREG
jgi:hypothetical protein